ncbi:hypothetical protein B484DRAFT_427600 [Ochromonadaceae sp. CCMP2298]|nr:hypothetical protein B484DRAFT_427600 [Ochromonadaceae sp. CCMP2298]
MSFACDSESPGSLPSIDTIDTEDIPIEQLIMHTQLTQDLDDLIAAGTVWSFDELDLAPTRPQDRLKPMRDALALTLAGRICECGALLAGDVARVSDENGHVSYHIFFDRAKNITCRTTDRDMAGVLTDVHKSQHFFSKISQTKGGKINISWSAQNIGKGPLPDVSKKDSHQPRVSPHGHHVRGGGGSHDAPAEDALGHKSDSALEGYIERFMPMVAAGATSILGASKPKLGGSKRPHEYEMTADENLPFWMKHQEGIQPYPMGSAPLDPKNDKRRCAQQISLILWNNNSNNNNNVQQQQCATTTMCNNNTTADLAPHPQTGRRTEPDDPAGWTAASPAAAPGTVAPTPAGEPRGPTSPASSPDLDSLKSPPSPSAPCPTCAAWIGVEIFNAHTTDKTLESSPVRLVCHTVHQHTRLHHVRHAAACIRIDYLLIHLDC